LINRGFSLIEVLIATTITVGVGAIVFQLFHQNERIFRDESALMEMQQGARMVASQIADDIRIAGQGFPPGVGDIVLPGSTAHRLNLRAGFTGTETIVTTALPFSVTAGNAVTLRVESTTGFSSGKQVHVWNSQGWLRATVDSVSGSAKTVRLTPTSGSAVTVDFTAVPRIAVDEGIAIYRDAATHIVRRTTSANTANPANPVWAPANELANNITALDFLYYDARGTLLLPDTPENRARIVSIETRVEARPPTPVAGKVPRTFALSIRAYARNLQYR
jgi:prepilin-type N-terminal cleavage/methylation domain-containing protein